MAAWSFPKRYVCDLISKTCECDFIRKKVCAELTRDLETRLSWIIQVSPKPNDMCPYRRETQGGEQKTETHRDKRGGDMIKEAETRVMQP